MPSLKAIPEVKKIYGGKPFKESIDFFKDKINMPTKHWDDLWQGMHARGFMVAGAMKAELLTDLRGAVDKAISNGQTLRGFRKEFDSIVEKNGWVYKGGRNWRTKVIYDTNVRQAYNAGRYKQQTDPDVTALRPYLQYRHGGSKNPREQHLAWDGLVLPHDDPFWDTHYPQNGWGCKCGAFSLSKRDLEKMGKKVPDKAPSIKHREWEDRNGKKHKVPVGIDPGFDYNAGKAAWGANLSEKAMSEWQAKKGAAWATLTPGDYKTNGRPDKIRIDSTKAKPDYKIKPEQHRMKKKIESVIGGKEKIFMFEQKGMEYAVLVNAATLAKHVDPRRIHYLPLLKETMTDPYEVWMSFEQHKGTGKVVLRQRIIKGIELPGKNRGMLVVTNAVGGVMEAWTVIPANRMVYINKQRRGKLIYP